MSVTEAITLSIAVLGAILGKLNTWQNFDKARVKLVVRPKHARAYGAADPRVSFCIEVTNLSSFPVTVSEVGVLYRGTSHRGAIIRPILADGGSWPRRLEARSSVTVYSQNPAEGASHSIRRAYVTTECGVTKRATSPALKQLARREL